MKKMLSMLVACAMLATATVSFAAAPSAYDSKSYGSLGYESNDPDGEFNLAVMANGDVRLYGDTMYIKGSVYSNGTIYAGNGQGNKVDGLLISGTENTVFGSDNNNNEWTQYRTAEGFVHVDDYGNTDGINYYSTQIEIEGAILDKNTTSIGCKYEAKTAPSIMNNQGDVHMTVYPTENWNWSEMRGAYSEVNLDEAPRTITEDTYFENIRMNGTWVEKYHQAMIVDTTNGDVTVVINRLTSEANPSIQVVGEHEAYIYINNVEGDSLRTTRINKDFNTNIWQYETAGSVEHTHVYITGSNVDLWGVAIAAKDVNVTTDSLDVSGSSNIVANVNTNAASFRTAGTAEITGVVCAPNADSKVVNTSVIYGQLHTNTLEMNGAGNIIYKADTAVKKSDTEPTPAPTATPTPTPEIPDEDEIDLRGVGYAYIFGYEPEIEYVYDEETGHGELKAKIEMAPNDSVTREQVAAMVMRMIDQKYDTKNAVYPVTGNIAAHAGTWYERGLAYLASKGTFNDTTNVETGAVTRGEVAKLVAFGLNLSETTDTQFADIADSKYKPYIEMMAAKGYMQGMSATEFQPDRVMTRAEFCSMFNQIINREDALLVSADGIEVTPELYSIVDLDSNSWYTPVMLRATSAYNADGYVDVETRLANIRNELDKYDAQKYF